MVKLRNYESKETEFGVKTYAEDLRLPLPHMYKHRWQETHSSHKKIAGEFKHQLLWLLKPLHLI